LIDLYFKTKAHKFINFSQTKTNKVRKQQKKQQTRLNKLKTKTWKDSYITRRKPWEKTHILKFPSREIEVMADLDSEGNGYFWTKYEWNETNNLVAAWRRYNGDFFLVERSKRAREVSVILLHTGVNK